MKPVSKRKRKIVFFIMVLAITYLGYNTYQLVTAEKETTQAALSYTQLQTLVIEASDSLTVDFEALQSVNPDIIGWLYSPNTSINYPVLAAQDYEYYLNHLPDGTVNRNGSLFLDYNSASDFSESLSIIYGHHMATGAMFASLVDYKSQEYYEAHPTIYLYTPTQTYAIQLLYGRVFPDGQWRKRGFMYPNNIESLLQYMEAESTFTAINDTNDSDSYIVLSTCSFDFDDARYAVIGTLVPIP